MPGLPAEADAQISRILWGATRKRRYEESDESYAEGK